MSDDQALPGNPLISAATRSGQSWAVMEITRFEASTRALQGCGCPADNTRHLLPSSLTQLLPREPGDGRAAPTCTASPSPIQWDEGSLAALPPQRSTIPSMPELHQFAAQILTQL